MTRQALASWVPVDVFYGNLAVRNEDPKEKGCSPGTVLVSRERWDTHSSPIQFCPTNESTSVFNTDQASQPTGLEFTHVLQEHGVNISMDGKGRYTDNIFVERLWRTVKYEEVYLKAYANASEARRDLGAYFRFYNEQEIIANLLVGSSSLYCQYQVACG